MARLDALGYHRQTLSEWKTRLENVWRAAYGDNINIEAATPDGQIIGQLADMFSEQDQLMEDVYQARSIYTATGVSLRNITPHVGVYSLDASPSYVNLTISTSLINTAFPANLIFSNGVMNWVVKNSFSTDGTGLASVIAESETVGAFNTAIDTITTIITPQFGLISVTNPSVPQLGRNKETDEELRSRAILSSSKNSNGNVPSVDANLSNLDGVQDVKTRENDTNTPIILDGGLYRLLAHSMASVVLGGNEQDIADMIRKKKSAGCMTSLQKSDGSGGWIEHPDIISKVSYDNLGNAHAIKFIRPVRVAVNLKIKLPTAFSVDYDTQQRIINTYREYIENGIKTAETITAFNAVNYVFSQLGLTYSIIASSLEKGSVPGTWLSAVTLGAIENAQGSISNVIFEYA